MVALKPSEITSFLKSPGSGYGAVLIFGPDTGLVNERTRTLAKSLADQEDPPGEIISLDETDLAANPDRLAVELKTLPMFGGKKVVRLKAGPRLNPKMIEALLSEGPLEGRLIIEAGDLKKGGKLRLIFEKAKSAAAIPCYADDQRNIQQLIKQELSDAGLQIDSETSRHLANLLGADRGLTRSELQKLILYAEGQSSISIDDIDAVVGDASELALDNICYAVMNADLGTALTHLERALAAGHSGQAITSALNRHIMRVFHARADIDSGNTIDGAMRKLRPPVFYKRQNDFGTHCRRWQTATLTKALSLVQETLKRCRTTPDLERAFTERLLMTVSRMAH